MIKITTLTGLFCGTMLLGAAAAPVLDEAGFSKLHAQLQAPPDEAWRTLPWQDTVLKASALAGKEKKPVYMLVRSGNPLGCV